jgi:hypothetical protein
MTKTRRKIDAALKAKIALEARIVHEAVQNGVGVSGIANDLVLGGYRTSGLGARALMQ